MDFTFDAPLVLGDHFDIPPDMTKWDASNYAYMKLSDGHHSPQREKAPFGIDKGMKPKTDLAKEIVKRAGVYLLVFFVPEPAYYVGITVNGDTRLKKHRIKVTGSNVGKPGKDGGVNHTEGWRSFAPKRASLFHGLGIDDTCRDAILFTGTLNSVATKETLGHVEGCIDQDRSGVRTAILGLLCPTRKWSNIIRLNTRSEKFIADTHLTFHTWTGSRLLVM